MNNHLKYFETCEYKNEIKHIDLSDNQILDISLLLDLLTNLETIYISKNFIKSIELKKQMKSLRKFICFDNMIANVKGLNNAVNLRKLNLAKNKLKIF